VCSSDLYLLTNLYPIYLANSGLRDATQKLIDAKEVQEIPALQRILIENRAALDRAIKAQQADAAG
jgi:aminopeptidase N